MTRAIEIKEACIKSVLVDGVTKTQAAANFGVNRKTVQRWCKAFLEKEEALKKKV